MITLLIILIVTATVIAYFGWHLSAPVYHGPVSDHFDGKKFFNPDHTAAKGFFDVIKWMVSRKRGNWKRTTTSVAAPDPVRSVDVGMRITFINHTTFLIQLGGINILTDPVWSERVSPFSWIGPRRMQPPALRLDQLPHIHVVLLSHNHYDHLDISTVLQLEARFNPLFFTPLGVNRYLQKKGIHSGSELDWWQQAVLPHDVSLQCLPALHFSGRGSMDRDRTLWCGFLIRTSTTSVYFAGDTGYHPGLFRTIGERCGPPDVSIIPIGAYKPRWFMSPIHCSPHEAVKIHLDVGSRLSIASHFRTFPLADDGQDDPIHELTAAVEQQNVPHEHFRILAEGVPLILE